LSRKIPLLEDSVLYVQYRQYPLIYKTILTLGLLEGQ